jgi:amino acid adenylation domain-containing protein
MMPALNAIEAYEFPASAAQQRLWYLARGDASGAAYNISHAVRLDGAVSADAVERALAFVVDRHEALRTSFAIVDGRLRQRVTPSCAPPFRVEDLSDRSLADALRAEAARPFDLSRAPLVRGVLFRLAADCHVLAITIHHIVCDGWSVRVLYRDLGVAYSAFASGRTPHLPPPALQYGDYAVWEEQELDEGERARELAFWRDRLNGLAPVLPLPADRPRPARPSGRGATFTIDMPPGTADAIADLARDEETTGLTVLVAALAGFLRRMTGATDIPIGTPVARRDASELEEVVGPLINTVVLRLDTSGPATLRSLIRRAKATTLDAYRHQRVPFEEVVQAVRPPRAAGAMPLFQVLVAEQILARHAPRLAGLTCTPIETDTGAAKVDLTIVAAASGPRLALRITCSTDLFSRARADSMRDALAVFLPDAFAHPDRPVAAAALMSPDRSALAERQSRGLDAPYPRDCGVHELVLDQASRTPASMAVDAGDRRMTYAELRDRAERAAAALQQFGVGRGDVVGICLTRGVDLIVAELAVLMAGAAYLPLDVSQPPHRLAQLATDARAVGVVCSARTTAAVAGWHATNVFDIAALTASTARLAAVATRGDDPAYVMYTSGSTGVPKGIVVPHRAIARLVVHTDYVSLAPEDRVAVASNPAFDASTFEVWGALANGACAVVLPPEVIASPRALADTIVRRRISVLFVTTAVFNRVAADSPAAFGPLRVLLFGGEASDAAAVRRVLQAGRPGELLHVYGPTECTTFATAHRVVQVADEATTIPIGRPIAHTDAWVLDERLIPVPPGVVGDLYLGGDGLAIGYVGRPELTAERFVPKPVGAGRLYRTGDRCRRREDGAIEFVGRADRQVKIRGFRIEPAEIEAALVSHPDVLEAAVDVEEHAGERRLRAHVSARAGRSIEGAALRAFLRQRLPAFMIPASFVVVDRLPLNVNGKVDIAQLGRMPAGPCVERRIVPARDPLEAELVRIWEEELGTAPIGITDDFFDLGGHSLLAARVLDRAEQAFGRRVPLSALMHSPTIETLATAFWEAESAASGPVVPIRTTGAGAPFFFLHGDFNGAGLYGLRLARRIDAERPFYLLAPHRGSGGVPPASIEAMAEAHLRDLRAARPRGPYAIGGYCHAALIAFEMVRRLTEEGETVEHAILVLPSSVDARFAPLARTIDAYARARRLTDAERVRLTLRVGAALRAIASASPRTRWRMLRQKLGRAVRSDRPSRLERDGTAPPVADVRRHDPALWEHYLNAVAAFVPRRYTGRLTLLTSADDPRANPLRGWDRVARDVDLRRIPGDHRTALTTYVDALGDALDEVMGTHA